MIPPAERDWFDLLVGTASALNTIVLLALVVVLVPAVWSFTRSLRQLRSLLDRVYDEIGPLTGHANRIAANVEEITETVRSEVARVGETVAHANRGLHQIVESTERRLDDFNALVQVAQQEVERAFVTTAATVRGVRVGAAEAIHGDGDDPENGGEPPPKAARRPRLRPRSRAGRKRAD